MVRRQTICLQLLWWSSMEIIRLFNSDPTVRSLCRMFATASVHANKHFEALLAPLRPSNGWSVFDQDPIFICFCIMYHNFNDHLSRKEVALCAGGRPSDNNSFSNMFFSVGSQPSKISGQVLKPMWLTEKCGWQRSVASGIRCAGICSPLHVFHRYLS